MKKIRVLFVHSSSELYGSDRSLLNIVTNLDRRKYRVYVILPCEGPLKTEMEKLGDVKVFVHDIAVLRRKNLSIKGGLSYIRDCRKSINYIKKFIKYKKIDIVDTNTAVVFPGAIAAKRCGIKSSWHIREIIKNSFENRIISFMMNRYADVIIANSRSTGEALKVKKSKLRTVYNAIEVDGDIAKTGHDGVVVGMAGRINRWKGQKLFVDAAEKVLQIHPDTKFWIAGDVYSGEEHLKEELVEYISSKNLNASVVLLGQVDDMPNFYRSIDIFVLPSIQPEPFGLVVIEAMAYKLPVVATNHGGPTEIITDGKDGYLVDHASPDQMADTLIRLIESEETRRRIGEEACRTRKEKYSVSTMVKEIETVFEDCLCGQSRG